MVRYIATILDPVYRKGRSFTEGVKKNLPLLSKTLEPYTEPTGELSKRRPINNITPYDISPSKPQFEGTLNLRNQLLKYNNVNNKVKKLFDEGKMDEASALAKSNTEILKQGKMLQEANKEMNALYKIKDELLKDTRLSKEQRTKLLLKIGEQIKLKAEQNNKFYEYLKGGN
jgi:hypothetical protein